MPNEKAEVISGHINRDNLTIESKTRRPNSVTVTAMKELQQGLGTKANNFNKLLEQIENRKQL